MEAARKALATVFRASRDYSLSESGRSGRRAASAAGMIGRMPGTGSPR